MRFAASEPVTNFLQRKENYQDLAGQARKEQAAERAAVSEAEGLVAGTGIQGKADIKSAKYGAAATRYAGQQAGNAAMFGGLMSGISGIAGGAINKFGSGTKLDVPFTEPFDLDLGDNSPMRYTNSFDLFRP